MTKVFTRLLLKQYLMQNQPNKILESKQKAPKLKKEIKILNIFDKKIKWKLFCLHMWKSAWSTNKRHKNTEDIFF